MFRSVTLPPDVKGRLLLHSMPGRYEHLDASVAEMRAAGVTLVVSLTPLGEIARKAPDYHAAILSGALPFARVAFEVEDFDAPSDRAGFRDFVSAVRDRIRSGEVVLAHCGAGIGRTGMFAVCLLLALGLSKSTAQEAVRAAGSGPERSSQADLIEWFASPAEKT